MRTRITILILVVLATFFTHYFTSNNDIHENVQLHINKPVTPPTTLGQPEKSSSSVTQTINKEESEPATTPKKRKRDTFEINVVSHFGKNYQDKIEDIKIEIQPYKSNKSNGQIKITKTSKYSHWYAVEVDRGEYHVVVTGKNAKETRNYISTRRKDSYMRIKLKKIQFHLKGKINNNQGYQLQGRIQINASLPDPNNLNSGIIIKDNGLYRQSLETGKVVDGNYDMKITEEIDIDPFKPYFLSFYSYRHKKTIFLDTIYFSESNRSVTEDYSILSLLPKPITLKCPKGIDSYGDGQNDLIPVIDRNKGVQGFVTYTDTEEDKEIIRTLSQPVHQKALLTFVDEFGEPIKNVNIYRHIFSGGDYIVQNGSEEIGNGLYKITYIHPDEATFQVSTSDYQDQLITLPNNENIKMTIHLKKRND